MKNLLVIKISPNVWLNATRDKKELAVCKELGIDTLVVCKRDDDFNKKHDTVDGFSVERYTTKPLGSYAPPILNRVFTVIAWAIIVRKKNPDIISGHNLMGLFIGYIATLFYKNKEDKPVLVYDSHEYELGRESNQKAYIYFLVKRLEGFLIKRCRFSIIVNDAIALELMNMYRLSKEPVVVRNIPPYWDIDHCICKEKRAEMLSSITVRNPFLLMYHGGVMQGRGIESLIEVLTFSKDLVAIILGNGEQEYINSLHNLALNKGVSDRVIFYPAVKHNELWQYVGAVDAGIILAPASCKNHFYSLPNKFFENIQSETPIICPEYPAMKNLVDRYGVAVTCNPENLDSIYGAICRLKTDKEYYNKIKENIILAKRELCWENEKIQLIKAYEEIKDEEGNKKRKKN